MAELMTSRAWLLVEFAALFFGVPWAMTRRWLPRQPILVLMIGAIACAWYLLSDGSFDRSRLWNGAAALTQLRTIALVVVTLAPLLCLVAWLLARDEMFMLLRQRPLLWLLIMVFYPVVSVYPQELIYRAFLFHRYAPLFTSRAAMVTASALAFSFAHVLFRPPWVAMSTCLVGGAVFAAHYYASASLAVVCWEHAIFGQLIFTVGLGRYFYHGAR
jgi:membrane protease YdiL (CAAX protease family)